MKNYLRFICITVALLFQTTPVFSWQDFSKSGIDIARIQSFETGMSERYLQSNSVQNISPSQVGIYNAKSCLVFTSAVLYLVVAVGINHVLFTHSFF